MRAHWSINIGTMFVQLLTVVVLLWNFKLVRGNGEDSENFFLSLQDCVLQIEQNGAYNNPRYVEYGGLEGQVQIVVAISLVLANSQSCQVLKEMFQKIRDVLCLTPFSGESYIWGALRGCGIFIQRWKIWQVLQAIDPVNCAIRWSSPIRHHLYSVKKPNHLANNLANTVLHCFVNGTQEFGLPFCVRGDRGVENVDVASFIIQNRWLNRGSLSVVAVFITRELNVYGQKSTEWYLSFTETSLFSWKRMVFLIQPMNRIYLPSIMFICHPYRLLWMNLSTSELPWFMYYE